LKAKDTWSEKAEIEAFQNSKKDSLDSYEELQGTKRELKSKDPGYFSKLTSKIIDNLQVVAEVIFRLRSKTFM
jgi:hypothetical protein